MTIWVLSEGDQGHLICRICGTTKPMWTSEHDCKPTPTMTQDDREELARALANAIDGTRPRVLHRQVVDRAIAPIIERMVAARVAAETERCAKVLHPALFPTDYNYKQALAAIRSATR